MKIRLSNENDIELILRLYDDAREFMKMTGNPTQWKNGGPNKQTLVADIIEGASYVVECDGEILATFYFRIGEDPTYCNIYNGEWLDISPYAVIHRVVVSGNARGKGISSFIFNECFKKYPNIKIDTHKDNLPMQKALSKSGFVRCGVIYLENGDERIAFQKNK